MGAKRKHNENEWYEMLESNLLITAFRPPWARYSTVNTIIIFIYLDIWKYNY